MEGALVGFATIGFISCAFCGYVAADKGRTTPAWAIVGFFLPFIPLLALIAVTNKKEWNSHERRHKELLDALAKRAA